MHYYRKIHFWSVKERTGRSLIKAQYGIHGCIYLEKDGHPQKIAARNTEIHRDC